MGDEIGLLHAWIDAHQQDLITDLRGVLRIPSKKEAAAGPGAPFGLPIRQALDYTLERCRALGFQTADVDGYAGHAEMGSGKEMVAALGHLDVVPEGEGWRFPPFGGELANGRIYGRGALDDKGPIFAALYAAKAIMESGLPLRRRIRVIFGCDEESGFGCVHYYWGEGRQERPAYAFTPDACFPLIYAEKGIANFTLERSVDAASASVRVARAWGGYRPNMVPDSAEALLEGDPAELYRAMVRLSRHWDRNVTVAAGEEGVRVSAVGKSAHGSTPQAGDNAIRRLARALLEVDLPADRAWLEWIVASADPTGDGLAIAGRDEVAGPLTCNLGVLDAGAGRVRAVYNIRYPVTWSVEALLDRAKPVAEASGWVLAAYTDSPPLYVPQDAEPVQTLLRIYREETGDVSTLPQTTGGGTYARATPRAVAFGPGFPGAQDGPVHEPDECITLDTLLRAAKIYAHALYELANLP
ncbi:MAG: dipeptidase PepV [Chthonomonadales bacterium]